MKKKIVFVIVMYCFIVGCNSNNITGDIDVGDVKVGDVNTGDVNTGNTDVGDIDTGDIDTGIYVKLEVDDIYSVEWECDGQSSGCLNASNGALETDCYLLLTTDIIDKAEREKENLLILLLRQKQKLEKFFQRKLLPMNREQREWN